MHPSNTTRNILLQWILVLSVIVSATLFVPWRGTKASERPADVGTVRQAYFYRPSGESIDELKQRSDILFFGLQDGDTVDKLRASGYTQPVHMYMLAAELEGPANATNANSACSTDVAPWRNNLAYEADIFCRDIHPHEEWFLHNSKGQRLYAKQSGKGGTHVFYYMNPGNAGLRNWMAQRMAQVLSGERSFDGIFLDNVELSLEKVERELALSNGATAEYADDAGYRSAWVGYLNQLSNAIRPNKQIWGNMIADPYDGSAWDAYMDYLDGGLAEAFAAGWPGSRFSATRWERHMQQIAKVLARGKSVTGVTQGERGSNALVDFGVGSYMLIAQGNRTFFRYSQYADYGEWYQSRTFDYDFGNPMAERYKQSDGRWRRDFEHGSVIVDPKNQTAEFITHENGVAPTQPSITLATVVSRVFVPMAANGTATNKTQAETEAETLATGRSSETPDVWDEEVPSST